MSEIVISYLQRNIKSNSWLKTKSFCIIQTAIIKLKIMCTHFTCPIILKFPQQNSMIEYQLTKKQYICKHMHINVMIRLEEMFYFSK